NHHDTAAAADPDLPRLRLAVVEGILDEPAPGIRSFAHGRSPHHRHPPDQMMPFGCQTVLVSVKNWMRSTEGAATPGSGGSTRLSVSAAATCRSTQFASPARSPAPARSSALTSAWLASHGAISAGEP